MVPVEEMKGKKILFMGRYRFSPLRTLILFMLDNVQIMEIITILYGSRTPPDLCYKDDLKELESRKDVELILTVDN
jgi:NAD(P)H-flavin reductase